MNGPTPVLHKFLWGALVILLVGVVVVGGYTEIRKRRGELPRSEFVPPVEPVFPASGGPKLADFTLTDQLGRPVTRATFAGHVWIADFVFIHCSGPCPRMTRLMSELQHDLPKEILLASFSVDPKRDTPAELKKYADYYEADHDRWRLLTGDMSEIYKIARELLLTVEESKVEPNDINHSTRFILVDRDGSVHGTYLSVVEEDMKKLRADVTKLVGR